MVVSKGPEHSYANLNSVVQNQVSSKQKITRKWNFTGRIIFLSAVSIYMVKYGTARTDYLVTILAKGNLFYVQRSASGDGGWGGGLYWQRHLWKIFALNHPVTLVCVSVCLSVWLPSPPNCSMCGGVFLDGVGITGGLTWYGVCLCISANSEA